MGEGVLEVGDWVGFMCVWSVWEGVLDRVVHAHTHPSQDPQNPHYSPVCTAAKNRVEMPDWCCSTPFMYAARSSALRLLDGNTPPSTSRASFLFFASRVSAPLPS